MAWSIFQQGGGDPAAVGWAHQFLKTIGAPETPGNVEFIYQWEKSEGGGGKYNPLNTGPVSQHPEWTTTGEQFGGGAADYASWEAGQLGSAYYLEHYQQATYSKILSALRSDNPVSARQALWASPWAESHYGYGSNWSNATVPGGGYVLPTAGNSSNSGALENAVLTSDKTSSGSDTCAWKLSLPLAGDTCVISKVQTRHIAATLILASALAVGIVGAVLLTIYASQRSGASRAVTEVAGAIPGEGQAVRAAAGAAQKSKRSNSGVRGSRAAKSDSGSGDKEAVSTV